MTSKAQKLKAKRGRPRVANVMREANGRAARAEPIDFLALSIRAKRFNIPLDEAKDQKAGSFLGYLSMIGATDGLSRSQYQAAILFKEAKQNHSRALQSADATLDNGVKGSSGDAISPEYEKWCLKAVTRYDGARTAIRQAQETNRRENLWAAVDYILIREEEHFHMVGAARIVCNALAKHFGV